MTLCYVLVRRQMYLKYRLHVVVQVDETIMRFLVTDPNNDYIFVNDFHNLTDHLNLLINLICRTTIVVTSTPGLTCVLIACEYKLSPFKLLLLYTVPRLRLFSPTISIDNLVFRVSEVIVSAAWVQNCFLSGDSCFI